MKRGTPSQSVLSALCLICIFGVAQPKIVQGKSEKDIPAVQTARAVQNKIEPSIVCLEFWTGGDDKSNGSYSPGTGFVISDLNGRKWIVTTAHSLAASGAGKKIETVMYYLPSSGDRREACGEVLVDEQYDLAMLSPNPKSDLTAPALTLAKDTDPLPNRLYAVGTAIGLPVHVECGAEGQEPDVVVIGNWLKRAELFVPLAPDLLLIRHRVPIAPGHSGAPVVDADGRVFGVQCSRARAAQNIGFAVHVKHLRNFFGRPTKPTKLEDLSLANLKVDSVLTRTNATPVAFHPQTADGGQSDISRPLTISLGKRNVEAPFIYHGYVEADAATVIQKYIEDRDWFLYEPDSGVRVLRLQQLLKRSRFARISNPLLGLQLLVPEGYQYGAKKTVNPTGIVVTLSPPAERNPSFQNAAPVTIWITEEPSLFEAAREHFIASVKSGKCELTAEEREFPSLLAIARENWEKAVIADRVDPRFCNRDLNIQTRVLLEDGNGVLRGNSKSELFDKTFDTQGPWRGSMNISATGSQIHNVRIASREPLVVTVHSQRTKEAFRAFNSLDDDCDLADCDATIIAASVSLR